MRPLAISAAALALVSLSGITTTASAQGPLPANAPPDGPHGLPDGTLLDVVATGRTVRVPDIATITAGVTTQGTTASAALAENAQRMGRVIAALKKLGIADRDITTTAVGLSPQYRYPENQAAVLTGYQSSNSVAVRLREIAASGGIIDTLVAQGANQIDGPALSFDNPDIAMDDARADAVRRARARADLYARAAGMTVVRLVSISEAGPSESPPGPVVYASAKRAADTVIMPGEATVTATVQVRFILK